MTSTSSFECLRHFLASASGPWLGPRAWTYDRIGNRLTETRSGVTDDYTYLPNGAAPPGNTAVVDDVLLAGEAGGTRSYAFGLAGHLATLDAGGNVLDFSFDAAGRLARVDRTAESFVELTYDGRSFLADVAAMSPAFTGRAQPASPSGAIFADGFESGEVCEWTLAVGWDGTECPQPPGVAQ